jgi:hypothetical protein
VGSRTLFVFADQRASRVRQEATFAAGYDEVGYIISGGRHRSNSATAYELCIVGVGRYNQHSHTSLSGKTRRGTSPQKQQDSHGYSNK